ncbi:uncharacterized protein LOC131246651 [Magnolia sinica]|uniref:uncharacterized protein LOC131246651 n=1 Tax=Magnolia sinica TaxID=86752 RepID=UPI0026589897|nr:uncharacterized protein LOC131246651 [Magnolia sinica]
MVPAPNLFQQPNNSHGGCVGPGGGVIDATGYVRKHMIRFDPFNHMAEDGSRASSSCDVGPSKHMQQEKGDDDDHDERDVGWLQLGIGSHGSRAHGFNHMDVPDRRDGRIQFDLLSDRAAAPVGPTFNMGNIQLPRPTKNGASTSSIFNTPTQVGTSLSFRQPPEAVWGLYGHGPWNPMACSSSSSSMPFYSLPHQHTYAISGPLPIGDMRVVDRPLRMQPGLWFVLQASQNQGQELFLPQIPKSYLRIKDGRMTVRLLMKYLSNKLGLNNESEVQMTCRDQQLLPNMTLQHVRDNIWCSAGDTVTLLTHSPSPEHVMTLEYSKRA